MTDQLESASADAFALAGSGTNDVAISPDGTRIYAAGADGFLRTYDATTGNLISAWDVGTQLGGIDISPDGTFVMVVELTPVEENWADPWWDNEFTITTYKVDLATGQVTSFPLVVTGSDYVFHDIAVLASGDVLLTQQELPGWSGWTPVRMLDLDTGAYSIVAGQTHPGDSYLSVTSGGEFALLANNNISDAGLYLYESGQGFVASHELYEDGVSGFNSGVHALSDDGALVAQYVPGNGLHIYNNLLEHQHNLAETYPQWLSGNAVAGLAFDSGGGSLFVLDATADNIVQLSTTDWSVIATIPVGADVEPAYGGFGNRLLVSPDNHYFTLLTSTGLYAVGNTTAPYVIDGTNAADDLTGTIFHDLINGFDGSDTLDGRAGDDRMSGGGGNDIYYVDSGADVIIETEGQGDDRALVLGTYTLAQGTSVETLVALNQSSTDPLVLTGNEYGQSLYGNLGDNYLNGGQGADYLVGLAGNDNLLGGTGADHMAGGTGNDVYYVDEAGDLVTELAGEGDDIVVATASYMLSSEASIEILSSEQSSANINLTGNGLAQTLYGNAGDNILTGMGGADYMLGGLGNDRYYVDASDYIGEEIGGGDDWIFVASSYTLREGNEIETLVAVNQDSTAQVDFSGNEFGQSLYGSAGVNNLNGGGGNDYLVGLAGNDFLIGGAGNDHLAGGTGNDLYYVDGGDLITEAAGEGDDLAVAFADFTLNAGAHVETLSAPDGTTPISLTGNELAQSLYGNNGGNALNGGGGNDFLDGRRGNDTLNGGLGTDVLSGGDGIDRFIFTGAPGNDTITDFVSGTDRIDLTAYFITIDQVSSSTNNGNTVLSVDSDNDGTNDFTITLVGSGAPAAGDYLF